MTISNIFCAVRKQLFVSKAEKDNAINELATGEGHGDTHKPLLLYVK
jgi:hypothetical protein